jgi:hypothetical protein
MFSVIPEILLERIIWDPGHEFFRLDSVKLGRDPTARPEAGVSSGWDPNARSEHGGARHGEKIFQQKNTFDPSRVQKIFQ